MARTWGNFAAWTAVLLTTLLSPGLLTAGMEYVLAPPRHEFDFPPGQSREAEFSLTNMTDSAISVVCTVEDWTVKGTSHDPVFFEPGTLKESCANWINIKNPLLDIAPGETKKIAFSITAPKDAKGGYRAVIFAETQSALMSMDNGIKPNFSAKIGCMIYYNAQGASYSQVDFTNLWASAPDDNKPLEISLTVKNLGNTHFVGAANALIADSKGKRVGLLEYPRLVVLQGATCEESQQWKGSLPEGDYDLIATLDPGNDKPPLVLSRKIKVTRGYTVTPVLKGRDFELRVENTGNITLDLAFEAATPDGRSLNPEGKKAAQRKILPHTTKVFKTTLAPDIGPLTDVKITVVSDGKTVETLTRKVQTAAP